MDKATGHMKDALARLKVAHEVKARLFNEYEAAEYLNVAVNTLRRWRWAGRLPTFVKIGGLVRYEVQALDDLINAGRRSSTSDPGPQKAESSAAHSP